MDRSEYSNFLRYSESTLNWVSSTLDRAASNLRQHGMSQKEFEVFVEQRVEEAWRKAEEESVDEDTKQALEKMYRLADLLARSDSEESQELAQDIRDRVQDFLEEKDLDEDFLPSTGGDSDGG